MLHAHLVFVSKYRRHVMTKRVFDTIRKTMRQTANAIDVEIQAIESDGDHIHLMIAYAPNAALSEIVRRLKGASSRMVRKMRFPEILEKLWGAAFWSPSYFVVSCGGAPLEVVKSYVESQQAPGRRTQKSQPRCIPNANGKKTLHPPTEVRGFRVRI